MCGIVGVTALVGRRPSISPEELRAMASRLARRGPDGEGTWFERNVAFAHRRLVVRDPSAAGEQPMATPDGRYHLLYNGELYEDDELRAELLAGGHVPGGFRGHCDTEVLLWALATWGADVLPRLRGMFALALYDSVEETLLLARDPLGIKPLYLHFGAHELSFASEPHALLAHPRISALPDLVMASAYLTTLRTSLGRRTLFRGVEALPPGELLRFDARNGQVERRRFAAPVAVDPGAGDPRAAAERVRAALEDSVTRHLRADVPVAALSSGGLDSAVVCTIAREHLPELETWCAGAREEEPGGDLEHARTVAAALGTTHHEVRLDRVRFTHDWQEMVRALGQPLSTPNEVAIHALARDLRAHGKVVALSGEGADELFGGYELALAAARDFCATSADKRSGGRFQLEASAWVSPALKPHLLGADAWVGMEGDAFLFEHFEETFRECARDAGPDAAPLEAHLRFVRRSNLAGLLDRLDRATMLASLESRTPFADLRVAEFADSLPLDVKWRARGKQVVRDAFGAVLPAAVTQRPKASFPLPFAEWSADLAWRLETSPFARAFFADGLRAEVAQDARNRWQLAWPMLNLALWGDAHWA
ncbi:MAG: asparagine synthase (glutamine-hydrolyzing) [Planctomycetes bacterium]|nr:asparagine synthase (glutamine-hydrolyzing) [Planctomycetota bacterium]